MLNILLPLLAQRDSQQIWHILRWSRPPFFGIYWAINHSSGTHNSWAIHAKLPSRWWHFASTHRNWRIKILDSRKNTAKKGTEADPLRFLTSSEPPEGCWSELRSGEVRPTKYLVPKATTTGSSLTSYTNSCLKVTSIQRVMGDKVISTKLWYPIHEYSWQLIQHCCWSCWLETLDFSDQV